MLAHDKQGFLVGELVAGKREMLDYQQTSTGLLRVIRTDVRAIARVLGARSSNSPAQPAGRSGSSRSATTAARPGSASATTQARGAGGRFVSGTRAVSPQRTARDGRGRFQGKGGGAGGAGGGGNGPSLGGQIAQRLDGIKSALQGAAAGTGQVDPALAAVNEVKDVVAPLGRGMFALLGRSAEKRKERWYQRFLRALTGRKDPAGGAPGMATEQGMGIGAIAGGVARFLPLLLTGLGALVGGGLALFLGTKLGGALYDWLDKSGIATKIFDAFDAVAGWIRNKVDKAKQVYNDFDSARNLARAGIGGNAPVLDASGRNVNDPRRLDAPTGVAAQAGRLVGSAQRGFDYMADQGARTGAENRALITGRQYRAGNIGNLSDAQTRALVASTVATESGGGNLGVVNRAGYMGRYQAGAGWLADAGLIAGGSEAVKAAMKADGFSNEYKWGQSGGMTRFLKNDSNWNNGLSYDKYLRSADVQDSAFKTNSDAAYQEMVRKGIVSPNTSPAEVAGLLKARHIAGMGGAAAVAAGGTGASDANGTTARKYFEDVTSDRGGFLAAYSGGAATAGLQRPATVAVPSTVPDKIPVAASVDVPAAPAPEREKTVRAVMREPIGQDVGDRNIAHIVSGGIGG